MSTTLYRFGIIIESMADLQPVAQLKDFVVRSRTADVPYEEPPVWHVNEYSIPLDRLEALLPLLTASIKAGWYAHAFNVDEARLIVILKGKSFVLPTVRDSSWQPMIDYGKSVGCDPQWTENIPLSV
jgi:hypothetical protein